MKDSLKLLSLNDSIHLRWRRQPSSYCYGPIVQDRLLTHRAGGKHDDEEDLRWRFPSPAGCREELLDPPDLRVDGGGGSRCILEK
jgi:hypothetical protein